MNNEQLKRAKTVKAKYWLLLLKDTYYIDKDFYNNH